jgi:hypothetical protein
MKTIIITVFFSTIFFICNAQNNYYWSGGRKVWLETDSTQMIIQFDSEYNMQTYTSAGNYVTKFLGKGLSLVSVQPESANVIQKINKMTSIVNKIYAKRFAQSGAPFYVTGDIIMQPKKDVSIQIILSTFQVDGQIIKETSTGIIVVRLSNWDEIFSVANTIYESGLVDWCHPNFITRIERSTNDPYYSQQWNLMNTGQNNGVSGIDIKAEQAWAITTGNSNIRVAVIDDGVENHADLSGRVLQGFTPLNSNGFGAPTTQTVPGVTIGHGQACAGIIAAFHNSLGIAGIAPNVQIIPINIFHTWTYNYLYNSYFSTEDVLDVASGIEFAWNPNKGNADVISCSWGYSGIPDGADVISQEITNATTLGRLRNGS